MTARASTAKVPPAVQSSYRDPAGFTFFHQGITKRAVTMRGKDDYETYVSSGLGQTLAHRGLILEHYEESIPHGSEARIHKVLVPEQIPYPSYPYEWCFEQLRDAALLTLHVQEQALDCGMSLREASAHDVAFIGSVAVFTGLSCFERTPARPWRAYRQFLRSFLGPLLWMQRYPSANHRLLCSDRAGVPLDLVRDMMPSLTRWKLDIAERTLGSRQGRAALAALRRTLETMRTPGDGGGLTDGQTDDANLTFHYLAARSALRSLKPALVFDFRTTKGDPASRASVADEYWVVFDADSIAVQTTYTEARKQRSPSVLSLVMNLSDPSPGFGFDYGEAVSLTHRPRADLTLLFSVVHELRIVRQVPFSAIARFLARITNHILVEFVPKSDARARSQLEHKGDSGADYTLEEFLDDFDSYFDLNHCADIPGTVRSLWLGTIRSPTPTVDYEGPDR